MHYFNYKYIDMFPMHLPVDVSPKISIHVPEELLQLSTVWFKILLQ